MDGSGRGNVLWRAATHGPQILTDPGSGSLLGSSNLEFPVKPGRGEFHPQRMTGILS